MLTIEYPDAANEEMLNAQKMVLRLMEMGVSKWRMHKHCGVSYKCVTNWEVGKHGCYYPSLIKLQELYIQTMEIKGLKFFD